MENLICVLLVINTYVTDKSNWFEHDLMLAEPETCAVMKQMDGHQSMVGNALKTVTIDCKCLTGAEVRQIRADESKKKIRY